MRTEIINNDIVLFLTSDPDVFLKTIKKRLKSWHTATDWQGIDFLTLILNKVANEPSLIPVKQQWNSIFDKLEALNFEFKSSHYFPKMYLGTSHNPAICTHYKELIQQLQNREVPFDADLLKRFVASQNGSIDDSVATILKQYSPDFEKENLKQQVKQSINKLLDEVYEMMLLQKASKKTQIERSAINMAINGFIGFGGDSVQSQIDQYLMEQSKKVTFILNYIDSYDLSQAEATELLLCFRPSSEVMTNLDRLSYNKSGTHAFAYMDINKNRQLRPRKYFTQQQIDLMDKIQDKFNVQILEKS